MAISTVKLVIIVTAIQSVMLVLVWNINKLKAKYVLKYFPGSESIKPDEMRNSPQLDLGIISMEMVTESF